MSKHKNGSVMVVGGGIAGMQAALDLADSGYYVYLVEKSTSIGGVMAQFDKTFPTNDCALCILSPKLVEVGRHMNIELLTLSEVEQVTGQEGDFSVKVVQQPRYVDVDKCIACNKCAEKCPKKVDDEYNLGLAKRKAAYVKYSQAVPLKYAIDPDTCIYFTKGKCRACEKFCPTGAVNFQDQGQELNLQVGAVILAPGFEPYDPGVYDTYAYGRSPNVLTSLEFERVLAASGPFMGHVVRPSDQVEAKRIAWIQCVGSRDTHPGASSHCSSVCCTYAIKQAVVAKEHVKGELDTSIFYIDMRTHGKDFERYYDRAREEQGVRFVKSRITSVSPVDETGNLQITYVDEAGKRIVEEFDIVVLSVGLSKSPKWAELAQKLGIELDEASRYPLTSTFEPIRTSVPGIFACGASQAPKDIPASVVDASAGAGLAGGLLAESRGTLTRTQEVPEERDIRGLQPRIGIFICHCGSNIAGVVDVESVEEYANTLPDVVHVERNMFSCSQDTQDRMAKVIREQELNRVVVAACTPRTHEPLFRETLINAGLNKYLIEMANIRNQDSWVHADNPEAATEKAKDMVRIAAAKVALSEPLSEMEMPVNKAAMVIGGGIAGMSAARALADQGYETHLVEKENVLGGQAHRLYKTWKGENIGENLDRLVEAVRSHDGIHLHLGCGIKQVDGFVGNFNTVLEGNGREETIQHGAAVIATGAGELKPSEHLYGQDERVLTGQELDLKLMEQDQSLKKARNVAFVQCVGSRIPERPYCSKVCCTQSIRNAMELKEANPDMNVYIIYRDMRPYGLRENLYRKAREKGVHFIRYVYDDGLEVKAESSSLRMRFTDYVLQRKMELRPDLLVLASAIVRPDESSLAKMFKVPINADGFFFEAHAKLRPVDFATDGVFFCGLAHSPQSIDESISQAHAAAARAVTVLSKDAIHSEGVVAAIDKDLCCGCQACVECCPFGAITYLTQEAKCEVNQALCKGCGTCAATCPSEAITLRGFSHLQLYSQIDEALSA